MNARTPDMLAAELGYSRAQIYAMIKRNEIGYVRRPGGHIRVLQKHIDEWIARNECPASQIDPISSRERGGENGTSLTDVLAEARAQRAATTHSARSTPTSTASPGR